MNGCDARDHTMQGEFKRELNANRATELIVWLQVHRNSSHRFSSRWDRRFAVLHGAALAARTGNYRLIVGMELVQLCLLMAHSRVRVAFWATATLAPAWDRQCTGI